MKIICSTAAVLALAVTPAFAQGNHPQNGHSYGYYCNEQNVSHKHVDGQKGTPFSQCVAAMKKADASPTTSGKDACKAMSKKHVAGKKRTPYSSCVVAVAQMRKDQASTS